MTNEILSKRSSNQIFKATVNDTRIEKSKFRLRACADSEAHADELRRLISAHRKIFEPPRSIGGERRDAFPQLLFDIAELEARKKWASGLSGDAKKTVESNLQRAEKLGPMRRVATAPPPDAFNSLSRDFPHFAAVTEFVRRSVTLCRIGATQHFKLQPVLMSGAPGVGKTAFVEAVATILTHRDSVEEKVPFAKVDVGSLTANFSLGGLDISYASARPGLIWELLQHRCMSPVIALDELDKLGGSSDDSHLGSLYSLLESVSSRRFADSAMGLPIDTSYISWWATCNDASTVEPALRSRFKVFTITPPTAEQMRPVVRSIHRAIVAEAEWAIAFEPDLSSLVIDALCGLTPREVGQALHDAYATAATDGRRALKFEDIRNSPTERTRSIGFTN